MKKIVINGDFYMHAITGVQRYAHEIVGELDELYQKNDQYSIELLIPEDCENIPDLKHISVIKYKPYKKIFWLQYYLWRYCKKNNAYCLCMCTQTPFFYPKSSINVIHDAQNLAHPEYYSKSWRMYNYIFLWKNVKKLKKIITVSEFSQSELCKYFKLCKDDILVVPSAWNHLSSIKPDYSIFSRLNKIEFGNYCYSLSTLSPNKNFKWILEIAKNNPQMKFVISGMKISLFTNEEYNKLPSNVIFTGYLSDSEIKALMEKCYLFLFPSLYEGFGLTPLEAQSCGAKIVVSDIPVMHEVYENSAVYIDPKNYNYNVFDLKISCDKLTENVLSKYSWKTSAKKMLQYIERI